MFGKRGSIFGKKGNGGQMSQPSPGNAAPPPMSAPRDSDGKRRIFGEAVYEKHGDFLRSLGKDINDPGNILPEPEDFDRKVKHSLNRQEVRRQGIEADLLARHGCNAIRPFFVLAEPVLNSNLGAWLIQVMDLMPYDEWNLVYLPTDAATGKVMDLPLHPGCAIGPIDELMVQRIGEFRARFEDARGKVDAIIHSTGQLDAMDKFIEYKANMRREIIDYVETVKPMIVELIADVQAKAGKA